MKSGIQKIFMKARVFQGGKENHNGYVYSSIRTAVESMEEETLCYVVMVGCS